MSLDNKWNDETNIKYVSKDEKYFEKEFKNKSFCFFPPNRYEIPHWMNQVMISDNNINIRNNISRQLNKPIIVQNVTESNVKWLLDIIVDSRADLIQNHLGGWSAEQDLNNIRLLKIARENVEEILSEKVKKNVKYGLNWSN